MHTLLVVNPASGQGRAAREKRKLLDLTSNLPHIQCQISTQPGDIVGFVKEAVEQGCHRVVAAGGDGTINQAINGIGDSGVPLGIVPLGTGNVLAHHYGIETNNMEEAVRVILMGKVADIDVAQSDGRRFVLMAGMGFDAAVVDSVSTKVKDALGRMAYAPAVLQQLFAYAPTDFHLQFAEGYSYNVRAFAVIVANCGTYAYNFKIAPSAVIDDGLLDILVFGAGNGSPLNLVSQAIGSLFEQKLLGSDAIYFKSAGVHVGSDPAVKVQLDGDVCMDTPMDVKVLPKALKLIVP